MNRHIISIWNEFSYYIFAMETTNGLCRSNKYVRNLHNQYVCSLFSSFPFGNYLALLTRRLRVALLNHNSNHYLMCFHHGTVADKGTPMLQLELLTFTENCHDIICMVIYVSFHSSSNNCGRHSHYSLVVYLRVYSTVQLTYFYLFYSFSSYSNLFCPIEETWHFSLTQSLWSPSAPETKRFATDC